MPKLAPAVAAVSALALCASISQVAQAATASAKVTVTATPITKPLAAKNQRATITVRNTTKARLTGLSLAVGAKKGVRVTLAGAKTGARVRPLKALGAGKSVRVNVLLARIGKSGPTKGSLAVSVRRGGKVLGRGAVTFGRAATPAQPAPPKTMTGRLFWGSRYTLNGIRQHTLYFTGPDFVFVDDVEGAWPVCTAVSETCKPYTFDPATGALTIDGKPATLNNGRLEFDEETYRELGRPTAGARWDIVLTYSNSSGICPLYCSYYTEHLTFRPDGTFIRSSVSSGSGAVVDWAVVPDDSKGTYEIRADRTLRLAYADGKERINTVGIYPEDDGSYPANPTAGAVLDSDGYFDIRD